MDLFASPSSSSSPPAAAPEQWQWAGGGSGLGSAACELACRVLCAVATCIFAAVGSLVGAVTGSMIGLATESGMLRGAGIGAISGAVFSVEVAESSRDLWHSSDSGVLSFLYMSYFNRGSSATNPSTRESGNVEVEMGESVGAGQVEERQEQLQLGSVQVEEVDIISSLLSGRLVHEKVGPAVQSAVQSQSYFNRGSSATNPSTRESGNVEVEMGESVGAGQVEERQEQLQLGSVQVEEISAISSPFAETSDLFETGGTKGLPVDSLHRLPEIRVTEENAVDATGEALCCSVCLQDFHVGESARRLPSCRHVFHMPCIDCWLVRHGSCPLCRRDI